MMKAYSRKPINDKNDSVVASTCGLSPPTNSDTATRLAQIDDMKYFFVSATQQWEHNRPLKRFSLPGGESISCVYYDNLFFITGTDIVRSLTFRFHAFGRPIVNAKKFEEGIFSDLRNLKPGHDARLEEPKSELLDMLYKNNCIRTQKKQKVFFWFSVPHDRLFLDALERDLKREKMGTEPTTKAVAEPASSLSLDSTQELFDQLRKNMSQSAAVTAQSMEQTPIPITSLSLNSVTQLAGHSSLKEENWSSPQQWETTKRPRVNSTPSSVGQKQQLQLLQQKQNRLSHGSYFSGPSTTSSYRARPNRLSTSSILTSPEDLYFRDDASSTTTMTDTNLSSPLTKYDYMDPIANGVHQLEITSSISSNSTTSTVLQHNVIPSKSLDSNALKKTKTIFGNLSLFDGSPTYKLRRRRASSVSTSILNPQLHGGPERIRRHDKCHLRTPTTAVSSSSSRLAMAAVKAGFSPNQLIPPQPFNQLQDYHCPIPECQHLFKRMEHLERHMQALHTFTCTVCGKQFAKSENLVQHHRLEHPVYDPTTGLNYGDHDDDSSHDDQQRHFMTPHPTTHHTQVLGHTSTEGGAFTSPRHSFDGSRSSGWSAGIPGSVSSSSRCSTLSPMLDVDFDMSDGDKLLYSFYARKPEDDFSSSSASSPTAPMTLLSPFKLNTEQPHMAAQDTTLDMDTIMFNNIMNDTYQSIYAPYVDQYAPFSSPDMNIVFGA